jgi:hypothetical protein
VAARLRYPTAYAQLRAIAEDARGRGVPFEVFWDEAIRPGRRAVTWKTPPEERPPGAVVWPADSFDRACARAALDDPVVVAEWRSAYAGEPSPRGAALLVLAAWLDALPRPPERTGGARVLA